MASLTQSIYALTFVKTSGIPGLAQDIPQGMIPNWCHRLSPPESPLQVLKPPDLRPAAHRFVLTSIWNPNFWKHWVELPIGTTAYCSALGLSPHWDVPGSVPVSEWKKHFWISDTYFRNAISRGVTNDVMSPSHYFTIRNRTNVFMAARLRMKLSCDMKFNKYPFDRQLCYINITTRKYS